MLERNYVLFSNYFWDFRCACGGNILRLGWSIDRPVCRAYQPEPYAGIPPSYPFPLKSVHSTDFNW
jgi:hypothetical protein